MNRSSSDTLYAEECDYIGDNDVVFLNESGRKLVRKFDSPRLAWNFVNRVKRNKKLVLCCEPARR